MIFESDHYPTTPGVYLMKNGRGRIIYVGKAKNLRRRLASYFRQTGLSAKTVCLVANIVSIDIFSTATEKEALLLEESLIKKHRPRYNIVLRDDKGYSLFKLDKRSAFPSLSLTRRVAKDGSVYFGPFTSAHAAKQVWRLIQRVFPLRKCKETVFKNRVRPCLYHHIGQCLGPCVLPVERESYAALVRQVESFLQGRSQELVRQLEADMREYSENLEFEKAAAARDQLAAVEKTLERQAAVLPNSQDLDAVGLSEATGGLGLAVVFVRMGRLLDKRGFFWPGLGLEEGPEVVASFLSQFYGPQSFIPSRILLPFSLDEALGEEESPAKAIEETLSERRGGPVRLAVPSGTDEKKLLEIAAANAREALRSARQSDGEAEENAVGALLAERLELGREPRRIECVDISHLGGEGTKAGVVVFENGAPLKEDYRAYNLAELDGTADDYLALATWARRRVESGPPWPDLLLVDGGRGQLSAVERALKEADPSLDWELASIAKASKIAGSARVSRRAGELDDRVFRPGRKNPLGLKAGSPELLFLQRVRDAAHNFVIGRMRRARSAKMLKSELLRLEGIGPKTARLLWERFSSLSEMAEAGLDDLLAIPGLGRKRAEAVHKALSSLRECSGA